MKQEVKKLLEIYRENLRKTKERFRDLQTETEYGKWIAYSQIIDDLEKLIEKGDDK